MPLMNERTAPPKKLFNPNAILDPSRVSDDDEKTFIGPTVPTVKTRRGLTSSTTTKPRVPYAISHATLPTATKATYQAAPAAVGTRRPRMPKNYGWGLGLSGLVLPVSNDDMEFSDAGDFGPRVHPVHGGYSNHTGIDMSGALGTPIRAVAPGIVEQANIMDSIYGNQLILGHGKDQESMYGHMAQLLVEAGERVKRGEVIGYMGSTGLATGDHLHFETWQNGQPVDPLRYLRPDNMISNLQDAIDPETRNRMMNRRRSAQQIIGGGAGSNGQAAQIAQQAGNQVQLPTPSGNIVQAPTQQPQVSRLPGPNNGNAIMRAFVQSMAQQESGGNYGAVGVPTGSGTAYGKYQILDSNFAGEGGWDMEALDQDITIEQYMRTPEFQEKIARSKLRDYFKQYGPEGAAKAWYAGPGNANLNSDAPQYGGPSVNDYAASVLRMMMERINGSG